LYYQVFDADNCADGLVDGTSNDVSTVMGDLTAGNAYLIPYFTVDSNTAYNDDTTTSGNGIREVFLHMEIQSSKISSSPLYTESAIIGNVDAEIRFCARFSLWNDYPTFNNRTEVNENAVEVNFLETIVTLNVDLSDGFDVASIAVEPSDRTLETAAIACEVYGYECNLDNTPISNPGFLR
jgi:hypothetical protein